VGETRANGGGAARDKEDRRRRKTSTQEEVGSHIRPFTRLDHTIGQSYCKYKHI
jgi:hypothetical protein